jgi:Icc-related predicted phosphoesterase
LGPVFLVSDLHGSVDLYEKLFALVEAERPRAVFIGGDILPSGFLAFRGGGGDYRDFVRGFLSERLNGIRRRLGDLYPRIFVIMGNDDVRVEEEAVEEVAAEGLWDYIHCRKRVFLSWPVYGYSFVPPTPFGLKDWEKYDVSRYVDPGSVSPEQGSRTVKVPANRKKYSTIKEDLEDLVGNDDLSRAVFLFHSPPYQTALDRAALDGKSVDGVPLDPHVGSIAIRRFIEDRQPLITLHGHVHESARLTGKWSDRIGRTRLFSAAHSGPELALVDFDLENPSAAKRRLI